MRRLAVRGFRWVVLALLLACSALGIAAAIEGGKSSRQTPAPLRVLWGALAIAMPAMYALRPYQYARRMHAAFEALARVTGGKAGRSGLLDPDLDLAWSRGGVRAHLNAWIDDFTSRGKYDQPPASARYRFRYVLELPPQSMKLRLDVRPETVLEAAAKMFGMQDLSLGYPDLDRQLIVQASDQDEYRRALERGLGGRIGDLIALSNDETVAHVSFVPSRLVVQRSRRMQWVHANEERAVQELHEVTLRLAAALTGLDVDVLLRGESLAEVVVIAAVPAGAACLVCGDALGEAPLVCARCETPHHRDCWDYNGACALYACGSREARRSQPPAAAT